MKLEFRLGIRAWLLLLALVAAFPVVLFSAVLIYDLGVEKQRAVTTDLVRRTGAMANAVEQRLAAAAGYLTTLANANSALRGDLPALYDHARRLVDLNPDVMAITLVDSEGRQIFNTLAPLGTALPDAGAWESVFRVFQTGRPTASGPFIGSVSHKMVTSLGVPVTVKGRIVYCLRMVFQIDVFSDLLRGQGLPPEWTAAIVDRGGLYVARTRSAETLVGQPASSSLVEAIKDGVTGVFGGYLKEGPPVKAALVTLPDWGWTVAAAVPTDVLNAPLIRVMWIVGLGGAVLVGLGIAVAVRLSAHLEQQVARVGAASAALGRGERPVLPATRVREFDELGIVLGLVKDREQQASLALAEAVVAHQQITTELSVARCDQLTGLPGRALFLDLIEAARANIALQGGRQLALLFVDLDGFKQVNDLYGHARGDEVLRQTAQILRDVVRETDIPARLGGDEFVVCVSAQTEHIRATAVSIAGRIVDQVGAIGNGIGCSIGIAVWPSACPDVACALTRSDTAMYEAKRLGKNRYVIYGEGVPANREAWEVACGGCAC